MDNQDAIEKTKQYLLDTYARLPVAIEKGKGVYLWDVSGKKYLDFVSGIGVNILGYSHPRLRYALAKQIKELIHVSNLVHIPLQGELAARLTALGSMDRAFFCNSGAEANEGAVKLARKWGLQQSPARMEVLTTEQSFHGRTLGMIAASGQEKLRQNFPPTTPGFRHIPFGDIDAARAAIGEQTVAILVEPIQGEGGVVVPPKDYLKGLKDLCQEHHLLLILDEVQTGMGRTGTLFAFEQAGILPDIVTLAKGLGGGVPIGALLARGPVAETFTPGDHASTFGGNPLACAAALAVLETLESEELLQNCQEVGAYLLEKLESLPTVTRVRGKGLMIGFDIDRPAAEIVQACLAEGLFINGVQNHTLRFLPPFILKKRQADAGLKILKKVLKS